MAKKSINRKHKTAQLNDQERGKLRFWDRPGT